MSASSSTAPAPFPAPRYALAGEACVVVEFGDAIDMGINACVQTLRARVTAAPFAGFLEAIPTYRSLAVCFNPLVTAPDEAEAFLRAAAADIKVPAAPEVPAQEAPAPHKTKGKKGAKGERDSNGSETAAQASVDTKGSEAPKEAELLTIPTCYEGDDLAPDLDRVASNAKISREEVVRRHTSKDCYCYMLGFVPGYSYLGGMDASLETPRLKEPRERIPAGSVAIGGKQTGIYPIDSPGGWNIIGRTPLKMFDPTREPAIFLNAGMWVRFVPISRAEFDRMSGGCAN
ncbi:MAG: 5-oxoprolinase subunit PxpB [Synergistaceae bacterium]|jgi:KipI family sensor histidine kinase inhibitor|nr:5-oxoprolinase subunit PxpB [Synergistaceae bacterium]